MSGQQTGDPAKLASALMQLIAKDDPPQRWPAGADAVETFKKKGQELIDQANDGGVTATYWYGELAEVRGQS